MVKSIMIYFFIAIYISSCTSYTKSFEPKEKMIEFFTPGYLEDFQEASFKISIETFDNHFGGIMVAKKLETNHYRFAFLNEFGGKMIDFEIINRELKLNYAIDQLNRKIILNLLEKDFSMLFLEEILIEKEFAQNQSRILQSEKFTGNKNLYYELNQDRQLNKIILAKGKEKIRIALENSSKSFPEIEISHKKLPIKIYLHLLGNNVKLHNEKTVCCKHIPIDVRAFTGTN